MYSFTRVTSPIQREREREGEKVGITHDTLHMCTTEGTTPQNASTSTLIAGMHEAAL